MCIRDRRTVVTVPGGGINSLRVPTRVITQDPAMSGTPEAASTAGVGTGGSVDTGNLAQVSDADLGKQINDVNTTQQTLAKVTGQQVPITPAQAQVKPIQSTPLNLFMPNALGASRSNYTSNIPGGPQAQYLSGGGTVSAVRPGIPADMLMRSSLAGPNYGTIGMVPSRPGIPADMLMRSSMSGPQYGTVGIVPSQPGIPADMLMRSSMAGPTYGTVSVR